MKPVGGDPPSASRGSEPTAAPEPSRSRGGPSLAALLVGFGGLSMLASLVGLFVFATTRADRASAPSPSAVVPAARPAVRSPLPRAEAPAAPPGLSEGLSRALPLDGAELGAGPEDEAAPLTVAPADAVWGDADAPVTLLSFLDLECEYSRQILPDLIRLKSEFGAELRWVYKHRPLADHALALETARTFAKAHEAHGKTVFFRLVLETAHSEELLSRGVLDKWLERSGLEPATLAAAPAAAARARVEADVDLAARFGVRATPTVFVNGLRLEGLRPLSELRGVVARELATSRWLTASGMPKNLIYLRRTQHNLLGIGEEAPSRECVPVAGSPALGPETAMVTIVQFSDYECRFCKHSAPMLKALLPRYKDQLKMVWKSFPLPQHGQARAAANFAFEAREIGGDRAFWLVHELLLAERNELDEAALSNIARRAGLPEKPLLEAVRTGRHDGSIAADVRLAEKLSVEGVPTFFVNGRRISGVASRASFENMLAEELASARKIVSLSRGPEAIRGLLCRP